MNIKSAYKTRIESDFSKSAKESVELFNLDSSAFWVATISEVGALRLAWEWRKKDGVRCEFSANLNRWYVVIPHSINADFMYQNYFDTGA